MDKWRPDLRLEPSSHLSFVAITLGLLAGIALLVLPLFIYIKLILLLLLVSIFWVFVWRYIRLESKHAVKYLRYTDLGWFIRCSEQGQPWLEVALLSESVVTARFVYLRFAPVGQPWYRRKVSSVLIASDSLLPEPFRRLKVFLRFVH
ncbi:MAG: hypothetical protein JKY01_12130 [Pseudomonadales bacterium]|nr:hypothetical protein [Pseudomonadales bacterium]